MRRLLAVALVLWAPASAGAQSVSSLRMRFDEAGADAVFDGSAAKAGGPPLPDAAAPAKPGRGRRALAYLDRVLGLESSVSVGPGSAEVIPALRVDIGAVLDAVGPLKPGTGHGWRVFLVDAAIIQGLTAAGLAASWSAGKALGIPRLTGRAEAFVDNVWKEGVIGGGEIRFKDPNYGDPWVNNLGHPAAFFAVGRYFHKRGYGVIAAFAGAMTANVLWEYLWEGSEHPKSGHDLFYMNLLGGLAGAHPDFGLAWGTSLVSPGDPLGHYTEFYYRKPGGRWRLFYRSEPRGDFDLRPDGSDADANEKPLFVNDQSLGIADERTGLSLFVTGVSDLGTKEFSEVGGVGDVFDTARIGVSLDPTIAWKRLR